MRNGRECTFLLVFFQAKEYLPYMQIFGDLASIPVTQALWGVGLIVGAYFCGSIPFGYLAGKLFRGIDLREHGSGNIGATNAVRVLGKGIGIPVFILDFLKGFLPVFLAGKFALASFSPNWASILLVMMAMAAVLGHTFTCWLKFKGGKGVATGGGVVTALEPFGAMLVIGVWIVTFLISRYVSLASILAAAAYPVAVLWFNDYFSAGPADEGSLPIVIFSFVIAALLILKHKDNIRRLMKGEEHRAFTKKNTTNS